MPLPRAVRSQVLAKIHELTAYLSSLDSIQADTMVSADDYVEVYVSIGPRPAVPGEESPPDNVPCPDSPPDRPSGSPDSAPDSLSEIEQDALTALGDRERTGRDLAQRAGYQFNSHFRTIMSALRRRGYVTATRTGYRRTDKPLSPDRQRLPD
jgi:hypothetical protein